MNNATIYGATHVAGITDSALYYDGGDSVKIAYNKSFDIGDSLSLALWFKTDSLQLYKLLLSKINSSGDSIDYGIKINYVVSSVYHDTSGAIWFSFTDTSGTSYFSSYGCFKYNDSKWHYVVTAFASGCTWIYVDGNLIKYSDNSIYTKKIRTGIRPLYVVPSSGTNKGYKGSIDKVKIYNRVLSSSEILSQYNALKFFAKSAQQLPGENHPQIANAVILDKGKLLYNRPNPFLNITEIYFMVPASNIPTTITELRIFDISGNLVKTLVNERKSSGDYRIIWDGRNDVGEKLIGGVYLYELKVGEKKETGKMMLLH